MENNSKFKPVLQERVDRYKENAKKDAELRYQNATEMLKDLEMSLKNPSGEFVSNSEERDFRTQRISLNEIDNKAKADEKKKGKFAKLEEYFEKHPVLKIFAIILTCILVFSIAIINGDNSFTFIVTFPFTTFCSKVSISLFCFLCKTVTCLLSYFVPRLNVICKSPL